MTRFLYRCLLRLHPSVFRYKHGDEMLCDFDESPAANRSALMIDALGSLARQWILRSSLWQWGAGAALTALLLVGIMHSGTYRQRTLDLHADLERPRTRLNRPEFNREASEAVAMLARFREADRKKSHPPRSSTPQPPASEQTSQD